MTTNSESELVAALKAGDSQGFTDLVNSYGAGMLAIARRYMRNEEDARDCFQDACMQVLKSIDSFEQRSTLKTWLHRITVNACLMKLRKYRRRGSQDVEFNEVAPQFDTYGFRIEPEWNLGESAESLLATQKNREFVKAAINSLPDDFRNVILLRDIEEYNTAETAELLDISEAAVKTRLHRAHVALKSALEPLFRDQR